MTDTHIHAAYIHADSDEIIDPKSFSGLSVVALILSLIGAFSILYVHFVAIGVIAVLLGLVILKLAPNYNLSFLSKLFAFVAIVVGTLSVTWGTFRRNMQTEYDLTYAKETAQLALDLARKDDTDSLLLLLGFKAEEIGVVPTAEVASGPAESTPLENAKSTLAGSSGLRDIRQRAIEPQWLFVKLDAEYFAEGEYYYKLRYRDTAQTIPADYWVTVKKRSPKDGPAAAPQNKGKKLGPDDLKVEWYFQEIEPVLRVSPFGI